MKTADCPRGARFRVITEGARLTGMVPCGPSAWQGWRHDLHVGDVIESLGSSMTFGDGVPAVKWKDPTGGNAGDITFDPHEGGMWGGIPPADGYLERIQED